MKKLLLIFLIIGIYLYISYAYFYNFLGQKNLVPPLHETNMIINNQPDKSPFEYLALGDSLTEGVGVSDYKNSFPFLVSQKLSQKYNVSLINLAHAGDTSGDVLNNQIPKILSLKPNLITLLIGVNDIHNLITLKEFENNYIQIVSQLKTTNAKICLFSIPYLGSDKILYLPYNFILDFRTKEFNKVIKKISVEYNTEYIDLYSLKKSADFYSTDHFHPGEAGYKEWAEAINVN